MKLGFMQGRLCDMIDGKIQAFPEKEWELEFERARELPVSVIEWTLDQQGLYDNPLMTSAGRERIRTLCDRHQISVASITGDCFMQAPFFHYKGAEQEALLADLHAIITAASALNIRYVMIPLVDNGSLKNQEMIDECVRHLTGMTDELEAKSVKILFESDFGPEQLADFIGRFPERGFGINYDSGNSAALGYVAHEELRAYGHRVENVHIKDRLYQGTTVPLGSGAVDFADVFAALKACAYDGHFILQTARAEDGDHSGAIARYCAFVETGWAPYAA